MTKTATPALRHIEKEEILEMRQFGEALGGQGAQEATLCSIGQEEALGEEDV
jgi:hypothetical protein